MDDRPALEIRSLTKRYGDTVAVQDLSFAVPHGSVTGFLGPNGAGKSTTMRVLLGLAAPSQGETFVLGSPYVALERPLGRVGASLELTGFHPGRTARNHLRVVAMQGGLGSDGVDRALEATGMTTYASGRVGKFSLGMKQRLALSAALLGEPEVLVLDEPANGLDPAGVAWLRSFLRSFADNGGAVLISSHILSEVAEVADRVVVIDHGRMVHEGPTGEPHGPGFGRDRALAGRRAAAVGAGSRRRDRHRRRGRPGGDRPPDRARRGVSRTGRADPARAADARPHLGAAFLSLTEPQGDPGVPPEPPEAPPRSGLP